MILTNDSKEISKPGGIRIKPFEFNEFGFGFNLRLGMPASMQNCLFKTAL